MCKGRGPLPSPRFPFHPPIFRVHSSSSFYRRPVPNLAFTFFTSLFRGYLYVHLLLLKEAFIYTFDSTLERDCAFAETVTPLSGFVRCSVRPFQWLVSALVCNMLGFLTRQMKRPLAEM